MTALGPFADLADRPYEPGGDPSPTLRLLGKLTSASVLCVRVGTLDTGNTTTILSNWL